MRDGVVGAGLLMLLAPVFALIGLVILVLGGGPVFTRAEQLSSKGTPFLAWRFRSGEHPRRNEGPLARSAKELPRAWIGVWLRHYKLDELPMLFNVVRGDITIRDLMQS